MRILVFVSGRYCGAISSSKCSIRCKMIAGRLQTVGWCVPLLWLLCFRLVLGY